MFRNEVEKKKEGTDVRTEDARGRRVKSVATKPRRRNL